MWVDTCSGIDLERLALLYGVSVTWCVGSRRASNYIGDTDEELRPLVLSKIKNAWLQGAPIICCGFPIELQGAPIICCGFPIDLDYVDDVPLQIEQESDDDKQGV